MVDDSPTGHWRQINWPWWHTGVVNCRMCGQMIPRDVWVAEDGLEFCTPECDSLYRSYWLPRYGGTLHDPDATTG